MSAPKFTDQPPVQLTDDLAVEVRALRDRFAEADGEHRDQNQSPQSFYERSVQRPDVREILRRLANG